MLTRTSESSRARSHLEKDRLKRQSRDSPSKEPSLLHQQPSLPTSISYIPPDPAQNLPVILQHLLRTPLAPPPLPHPLLHPHSPFEHHRLHPLPTPIPRLLPIFLSHRPIAQFVRPQAPRVVYEIHAVPGCAGGRAFRVGVGTESGGYERDADPESAVDRLGRRRGQARGTHCFPSSLRARESVRVGE